MNNDIFLCHTGTDKDWTRDLAGLLEQHQIGNRQIKVFFDEWDIDYGKSIVTAIDEGLKQSRYVGLVLSPAMVRADWPTAEWQSQIMDDPTNKKGRILPLLLHKYSQDGAPIELPFVLKNMKRFDFTQQRRFASEFERLLRKLADLPPVRGSATRQTRGLGSALHAASESGQDAPDAIEEALTSNLLPVTGPPEVLYSDETNVERKTDVWKSVKGTTPPFFIDGKRLYSFVPNQARRNPFRPFLLGRSPKDEPLTTFLSDRDKTNQIVGAFNSALRQHCYDLELWTAKTDRRLFYPPVFREGQARTFSWGKGRPRTIAVMKPRAEQKGSTFGVHMAARMRFLLLGGKFFLLVEPAWMFTVDGVKPVEGKEMGVFSTKWGGREKNAALLRNVLMWALLISKGQREIKINLAGKGPPIVMTIQSVPAHTKINVGIFGDTIRLDGILSGEGAGEQVTADEGQTELDRIATLALTGEPGDEEAEEPIERAEEEEGDEPELF